MSVTSYDGSFSFKQDSLARLGDRANRGKMSATDMQNFQNSPFMQSMRKIEELTFQKMSIRDKKRQQSDPSFKPSDEDFEAAKSHKYDKCMNYYKTLGIDEYSPQKEVKEAYKRLSLVYHPDKSAGLPSEVKEEYALIFIELKNAYQTLADNPTRRQYDRDRDKDIAAAELNGWKVKERAQFDATEVMKRLQEERVQKKPSKLIELTTRCRLEKFFYGGHKALKRKRRVKSKMGDLEEERLYRIDVPAGHAEPFVADFRRQGDQHEDQHADTLRFSVTSKPHEVVERRDKDLVVKSKVPLPGKLDVDPFITTQVASIRGRHFLVWGLNPFFRTLDSSGDPELRVQIKGEGLGETGSLIFTARSGAKSAEPSRVQAKTSASDEAASGNPVVISVKHLTTEAELFIRISPLDLVGDVRKKCIAILNLNKSATLKLLKPLGARFTPLPDSTTLWSTPPKEMSGEFRQYACGGTDWHSPALNVEKSLTFLKKVFALSETSKQKELLATSQVTKDKEARMSYMRQSSAEYMDLLPDFGLRPSEAVLLATLREAAACVSRSPEGQQLRTKLEELKAEWDKAKAGTGAAAAAGSPSGPAQLKWEPGLENSKRFLTNFKLGPENGFKEREVHPAMQRRVQRRLQREPVCDVTMSPLGGPVTLHTKPGCQLNFYSNFEGSSRATSSSASPGSLFAVCLSSQACSKGKMATEWDRLKYKLMPLIEASCFKLVRAARTLLPKSLPYEPAFSSWGERRVHPEDSCAYTYPEISAWYGSKMSKHEIDNHWEYKCTRLPTPPTPWKRLGDEAFRRGDFWEAMNHYSSQLEDLPAADASQDAGKVLSNRAACFAKVKEFGMSLQDARTATQLLPTWAKAWSRVGVAASQCGSDEDLAEARSACFKAVVLEPNDSNVAALHEAVRRATRQESEAAHKGKEAGNEATRVKEWSTAVACYTEGLAQLPPEAFNDAEDELTFLRCVLLCNRSGAFARLRNFAAAVADGKEAVQVRKGFAKAHCRLGVALLGSRQYEQAYTCFAKSLVMQEDYAQARKGRNECLRELLRWKSIASTSRLSKRLKDAQRAKGTSRVFAICDVHFDHKVNEDWAHAIDDGAFQDDVLIVAGDLAGTKGAVVRGLTTLRAKFRRVFYTVGHHEMWVHYGEHERYPDSIAKLHGIFETCDELGVDVVADAICEDVFVVPLHSWYNAEFDESDPWPDANDKMDSQCRWPMDPDDQVWKYMLKMNEGSTGLPFHGTVITFSHFLPRRGLPVPHWPGMKTKKSSGCERIDDLIRGVRSNLHVFGHSHQLYCASFNGVMYVNQPLGFGNEQPNSADWLPMLLVYDGRKTVARQWDIASDRPRS